MIRKEKIAVILAAHGEAETNHFIENYRVTSKTLAHVSRVMPIPLPLQKVIALSSSLKKRFGAPVTHVGSPQNRITREQALALQQHFDQSKGVGPFSFDVHAAFSASPPYIDHLIDSTRNYDGQVIVSMAPVDTSISCGLICSGLATSLKGEELAKVRVISRFWDDEQLCSIYCNHLFETNARNVRTPSAIPEDKQVLLLLFHGTLVTDVKGDLPLFRTGLDETTGLAARLRRAILSDSRNRYGKVIVVYLNHDVGGKWTSPSFAEVCAMLRQESGLSVDLFGCGYFSDGNETIHRLDELTDSLNVTDAAIIPSINTFPSFIDYLASRVTIAARQITGFRCAVSSAIPRSSSGR
jgi:ferrochelatase